MHPIGCPPGSLHQKGWNSPHHSLYRWPLRVPTHSALTSAPGSRRSSSQPRRPSARGHKCPGTNKSAQAVAALLFAEILFCCHKCRASTQKTVDGATLRYCQRCKVGYCSSECQRADWASHKRFCKRLSKHKASGGERIQVRSAEGKKNVLALKEWFSCTLPESVRTEVIALAWKHRAQKPVIKVATSPVGADANAPRVTVGPGRHCSPRNGMGGIFHRMV